MFLALLKAMAEHKVEYILIGGWLEPYTAPHGSRRKNVKAPHRLPNKAPNTVPPHRLLR